MASSSSASNSDNCGTTKRIVEYFYEQDIGNYHFGPGHPMKVSTAARRACCRRHRRRHRHHRCHHHLRFSFSAAATAAAAVSPSRTACA